MKNDGTVTPVDVKAGDKVLFGKYSGQESPDGSGSGQQDVRLAGDGTTTGTVLVRMTC